ncbi:MAG: Lrp/AsnC ligand binding domain-containing protein [Planctomycetes bacterium]|nr:Lrp/AsnC ligand binding domain-containing protein [Planctomycetota bacterium]
MTVSGLVLVKTEPDRTMEVITEFKQKYGSKAVFALTGRFDVLVITEFETLKELVEFVNYKIRTTPGVASTATEIVLIQSKADINFNTKNMWNAFTFLKSGPAWAQNLFESLQNEEQIKWIAVTTGEYDLAVFISAVDSEELKKMLFKISGYTGIKDLETFLAVR